MNQKKKLTPVKQCNTDLGNSDLHKEVSELKEAVLRIEALIAKLLEILPFRK